MGGTIRHWPTAVSVLALAAVTWWAFAESAPTGGEPGERVSPRSAYNPVTGGEPLPQGFRQLLGRDSIAPIYEPAFVAAEAAGWNAEVKVIGVEWNGEAKAYPVRLLTSREMVIDEIAGEPILVSW